MLNDEQPLPNIIIGALSGWQHPERRERCRRTWVADVCQTPNLEFYFLMGASDRVAAPVVQDDLLLLPCANNYESLPQRTRWFCEWALSRDDWDYLFKCDDDTYVCIERLSRFNPEGKDYIGAEWHKGVQYGSGGAGYLLSRRAVGIIADALRASPHGAEDLLVGQCLKESGIKFHANERFVPYGNEVLRPTPENQIITSHASKWPWIAHETEFLRHTPKVSCRLMGGLGNQLFQVAATLGVTEKTGQEPVFSSAAGRNLPEALNSLRTAEPLVESVEIGDKEDFSFNPNVFEYPGLNVTITGYMQSERYFAHCAERIREAFRIDDVTLQTLTHRFKNELSEHPVGMHVRRGDYLKLQQFHPVQPANYYLQALNELSKTLPVTRVLCCTDDPDWCEKNLSAKDQRIVVVRNQDKFSDLALLSLCSHHILSNSTFSWWGAWLAGREGQRVIIPDQWFGPAYSHFSEHDLCPESWTRIGALLETESIHPRGYRVTPVVSENDVCDQSICDRLIDFFHQETGNVIDLGCGSGQYVRALRNAGIECDGCDGNPHTHQLTQGDCGVLDLTEPQSPANKYDWAVSIDVEAEIPDEHKGIFYNNLDQYNRRGFILGWSSVQKLTGHPVSEEHVEAVRRRIEERGYLSGERLTCHTNVASESGTVLMVFRRSRQEKSQNGSSDKRVLWGEHPCWSGPIHLFPDGRMARPGSDEGSYTLTQGDRLVLAWDAWPSEELFWNASTGAFLAQDKPFIVKPQGSVKHIPKC